MNITHHKKWVILKEKPDNIDALGTMCSLLLEGKSSPTIIIQKKNIDFTTSKQEFIDSSIQSFQKLHPNKTTAVNVVSNAIFDSGSGYEIRYHISDVKKQELKILEIGKLDRGQVFYATYLAKSREYKKYEREAREIIGSIDIKEIAVNQNYK